MTIPARVSSDEEEDTTASELVLRDANRRDSHLAASEGSLPEEDNEGSEQGEDFGIGDGTQNYTSEIENSERSVAENHDGDDGVRADGGAIITGSNTIEDREDVGEADR